MKKILMASIIVIGLASCGGNNSDNSSTDAGTNTTPNTSAPSTMDTTTHDANGITNSNVISTDTNAMKNALPKKSMDRDSVK